MRKIKHKLSAIFALLIIALFSTGCATNPVTGKTELHLISESQEISIGAENYVPSQQSQGGPYTIDPQLSQYVSDIGKRLASVSDRPNLPYEFVVLNNSVPNAWALPGGKIAINRGLLTELNNEAELAAVIGHEIVHAAARHGAKSMERGILLSAGVAGVAIATGDSDYGQWAVGAAAIGSQLIATKYSRSAELESDYHGMRYMAKAGYDPSAAIGLQQTFVRLSQGRQSNWLDGLFASHPPSQERVEANRRTAKELNRPGKLGEQEYQTRIAHLIKTKPAYDAMDQANKALKDNDPEKALALADKAINIEPRESQFYGLKGDVFAMKKQWSKAEDFYTTALEKNNQFFLFYLQRGLTREKLNKLNGAKTDLTKSIELLPTAPAYATLGDIALKENDTKAAKEYYAKVASNDSELGKKAATALAKLDMSDNPLKYIHLTFLKTTDGRLALEIKNQSPVNVKNLQIEAKLTNASGALLARETFQHTAVLAPGESKQFIARSIPLPTDLQTQKLTADITNVIVAE
ncbi:M48 family metalloprotease [Kaarinaea lacus]